MDKSKKYLAILGFIYLIFVIYGSLVPLNFTPISSTDAWNRFIHIRYLELGIASRADWVANILLFIPLTFLGLGVIWNRFNYALNIFGSLIVLIASFGFCITLEYTQIYFPPRTVSLNDILAESLGAFIGITLWWLIEDKVRFWLNRLNKIQNKTNRVRSILHIYVLILFVYNVMPLDLTISPVELYHKWSDGRIMLIPFGFYVADPVHLFYNLITDILIWIPVPILLILSNPNRKLNAFIWTMLSALFIEISQLFVFSRVTDITDLITAFLGAGTGVWLGIKINKKLNNETSQKPEKLSKSIVYMLYGGIGFFVWSLILAIIFWYPFNFRFDRIYISERLERFFNVPFTSYYYGTEFRALTELLHKIVFFAPLGFALAIIVHSLQYRQIANISKWFGFLFIVIIATGIEIGQVALPDKFPNNTDIILEIFGGILGYWLSQFILGRANQVDQNIGKYRPIRPIRRDRQ